MREEPSAEAIAAAVAAFLREPAAPGEEGRHAFHARVAANALDIVARELALGPAALEAEAARLRTLLGEDGDGEALNRRLCERIASGAIDPSDPALIDHLWRTTLDTLAIDQPKYATYRRVLAARGDGAGP